MKRRIGRIGDETSALGMGCWAIGGIWTFMGMPAGWGETDDDESLRAIRAAYDHGIRVFDTAANYGTGHSESLLGRGLGADRPNCIISTKFGFNVDPRTKQVGSPSDQTRTMPVAPFIAAECEASLSRLHTDYIDIYFFHINDYDNTLALDVREQLERLVEQGKIRGYGWSTDSPESAAVFAEGRHCSAVQTSFSVAVDQPEILALCEEKGMTAFNRGPLAMGFLTGKYGRDTRFPETDVRTRAWAKEVFQVPVTEHLDELREVLTSGGRTLAQGALAYIWGRSGCTLPIPGIRTVAQAEQNAAAMEFGPLTPDQVEAVDRIMGRL